MADGEWEDWTGAVAVSETERNEYAKKAIQALRDDPEKQFVVAGHGDTLILVVRLTTGTIRVEDCLVRRIAYIR